MHILRLLSTWVHEIATLGLLCVKHSFGLWVSFHGKGFHKLYVLPVYCVKRGGGLFYFIFVVSWPHPLGEAWESPCWVYVPYAIGYTTITWFAYSLACGFTLVSQSNLSRELTDGVEQVCSLRIACQIQIPFPIIVECVRHCSLMACLPHILTLGVFSRGSLTVRCFFSLRNGRVVAMRVGVMDVGGS